MSEVIPEALDAYIDKWSAVSASELATSQPFLLALCELLQVEAPDHSERYMFEHSITFKHRDGSSSAGRIDLYLRGAFILDSEKLRAGDSKRFEDGKPHSPFQWENSCSSLTGSRRPSRWWVPHEQ